MDPSDRPQIPDEQVPNEQDTAHAPGVSRRGFVRGAASAAGLATVATFWFEGMGDPVRAARIRPTRPGAPLKHLTEAQFRVVEAMVDRLLPSEGHDAPGARDVQTAHYIDAVLADEPVPRYLKERLLAGIPKADMWAQKKYGQPFADLADADKDGILRMYHLTAKDTRFLRLMLEFTLECFFCDPVRGGNLDKLGWRWAQHDPGSPRPTRPGWRPKETL